MSYINVLVVSTIPHGVNGLSKVIENGLKYVDHSTIKMDFVFPGELKKVARNLFESKGGHVFELPNRLMTPIKYIKSLSKVLKAGDYDVIHVHGNSHTMAIELSLAKKYGVPVRMPHSHSTTTKFRLIHQILSPLFYSSYTHGLACGYDAGEWLFDGRNFEILDNGIEIDHYLFSPTTRESIRRKLGYQSDNYVIGLVANFFKLKNHEYLIKLFSKLDQPDRKYRLILVGDGPLRSEVEELVEKMGLTYRVTFTGNVDNVNEYLMAMDLFLMPSIREGFPLVLVEAQASGLTCLVSDAVTHEVNISGLVDFFSLDNSLENIIRQADGLLKRSRCIDRELVNGQLQGSKYDVNYYGNRLTKIYLEAVQSSRGDS